MTERETLCFLPDGLAGLQTDGWVKASDPVLKGSLPRKGILSCLRERLGWGEELIPDCRCKNPVLLRPLPCTADHWGMVGGVQEFTQIMSGCQSMPRLISLNDREVKRMD